MSDIYLLDDFKSWIKLLYSRPSNYISWLRLINRFIDTIPTGTKQTPMDVLKKYMTGCKSGPKSMAVAELLSSIQSAVNKELKKRRREKTSDYATFENAQSAFNKYVEFILYIVNSGNHRNTPLTPSEKAILAHIKGEDIELGKDQLITIFASRISTQDRITGQKAFLPLGLLMKALDKGVIRNWAIREAENVIIHLKESDVAVKDIKALAVDTKSLEVIATLPDGTQHPVYNPPLNADGKKERMKISMISDTDIDHDPEIHTILRQLRGSLTGLEYITSAIHNARIELGYKTINSRNCDMIYSKIAPEIFNPQVKSTVEHELAKISTRHTLQLATKEWNRPIKKIAKHNNTDI